MDSHMLRVDTSEVEMHAGSDLPILVAVESADQTGAALAYAEAEAARKHCGLLLMHVVNPPVFTAAESDTWLDFLEPAEQMMRTAAKEVDERLGGAVSVDWEVARGPVVSTIVSRSAACRAVVMQGEEKSRLERWVTGQVRNGVAARAPVPVVCVPAGRSRQARPSDLVVVGVDDPGQDPRLIRIGLCIAAERGFAVRFLHAWWFKEPLDETAFTSVQARQWCRELEGTLRRNVERECLPGHGAVEVKAVHRQPVDALVEESRHAGLLLVGRRDPRLPFGSHLGPVTRAVLRRAECPVMVVEPGEKFIGTREERKW